MSPNSTTKQCPQCGQMFTRSTKNPHTVFCSPACAGLSRRRPFVDRFWEKVEKTDQCWEWTGGTGKTSGYGVFEYCGKQTQPHRIVWELAHGPIVAGLYVCHRCDNRLCVRLDHLFLGTPKENTADMIAKGRVARGDRMPQTRLTPDDVRAIRASSENYKIIAARYGIRDMYVYEIRSRRVWKHID